MEDVLKNVQELTRGDQVRGEGDKYCKVHKVLVESQFNKVWVAYQDCNKSVFTLNDTVWVKSV
jgi:hypothetical protein